MASLRNQAASFNPSNERLLGPKTFQTAKLESHFDDQDANDLYDRPLGNTYEEDRTLQTADFQGEN
jgi:hypothetical protein